MATDVTPDRQHGLAAFSGLNRLATLMDQVDDELELASMALEAADALGSLEVLGVELSGEGHWVPARAGGRASGGPNDELAADPTVRRFPLPTTRGSIGSLWVRDCAGERDVPDFPLEALAQVLARALTAARGRAELERSERRYRLLVESSQGTIVCIDERGRLSFVSAACGVLLGQAPGALLGRDLLELAAPGEELKFVEWLARCLADETQPPLETRFRHRRGRPVDISLKGTAARDDAGNLLGLVATAGDTTSLVGFELDLVHQALHDTLTDLPNRRLFDSRLAQALHRANRRGSPAVVLLLDLDGFKSVNDTLGHLAGDRLLAQVAKRLASITRASETFARLGGDEFALIVEGVETELGLRLIADRVRAMFAEPFTVGERERHITCSIGIACTRRGESRRDPLRDADIAMYRAKRRGGDAFELYREAMGAEVLRAKDVENALIEVIRTDGLDVHYQPIVALSDGEILAVEALVRWSDPLLGEMAPGEFVPLAEASHLIGALGRFVLTAAVGQLARWRGENAFLLPRGVFVNVSPRELADPSYVPFVVESLRSVGMEPSDLALELTERMLLDNDDAVVAQSIAALADLGVRLSLDDFGTGYSSLSLIGRFPLDSLKIDRSFVEAITSADADALIVRSVVSLGDALGMQVIAEGVENDVQLDYLQQLGCGAAQGFLLARPQPAAEITRLLTAVTASADPSAPSANAHPAKSTMAPIPDDEAERLTALYRYGVLDSEPEPAFDELARLAAAICDTPFAFISLVDAEREFFKAAVGSAARESPRDISFCGHAIHVPEVFLVPDTLEDARFAGNPNVTGGSRIRFYAGAPILSADGYALGELCVKDLRPRTLSRRQRDALAVLAQQVTAQLELRRLALRTQGNHAHQRRNRGPRTVLTRPGGLLARWRPAATS